MRSSDFSTLLYLSCYVFKNPLSVPEEAIAESAHDKWPPISILVVHEINREKKHKTNLKGYLRFNLQAFSFHTPDFPFSIFGPRRQIFSSPCVWLCKQAVSNWRSQEKPISSPFLVSHPFNIHGCLCCPGKGFSFSRFFRFSFVNKGS